MPTPLGQAVLELSTDDKKFTGGVGKAEKRADRLEEADCQGFRGPGERELFREDVQMEAGGGD